jgi:hypothetical protein
MLKSRALPDDFDMAQALHSPYGSRPTSSSTTLTSPGPYFPAHTSGDPLAPLVIDNMETFGDDEYVTSPLSETSPYGTLFTSSHPGPEPDTSPISTRCDSATLFTPLPTPQASNPRNMNLFTRSSSLSSSYTLAAHPQIPRLQSHEGRNRVQAGSLTSTLRDRISYSGSAVDYGDAELPVGLNIFSGRSFHGPAPQMPVKAEEYGMVHYSKSIHFENTGNVPDSV